MLPHTEKQAIALPPPVKPLPLLPPLLLSLSALLYQNLRPITEALLTRHLSTRTTMKELSITPFRIRGLLLSDKNAQPLLTAEELSFSVHRKTCINFALAANGITLHADINPVNWAESNWTTHLSEIASTGKGDRIEKHENGGGDSMEVELPKGWFAVSMTTKQTSIHIVKPSLSLPLPPLVIPSTDLSSVSSISQLIDGLLGRAARDTRTKSLPKELRLGKRRAARSAAVKAVDDIFADAGRVLGEWRQKVDEAREYVEGLPDTEGAQRVMEDVGGVLNGLGNLLTREEEMEKSGGAVRKDGLDGFRELDEGDAEQR